MFVHALNVSNIYAEDLLRKLRFALVILKKSETCGLKLLKILYYASFQSQLQYCNSCNYIIRSSFHKNGQIKTIILFVSVNEDTQIEEVEQKEVIAVYPQPNPELLPTIIGKCILLKVYKKHS